MAEAIPEIRLALFGPSGAGKTTLLASYFGNQQRNNFEEAHGYRLEAEDTSDGNRLLARYYQMEKGNFPVGTVVFSEYTFLFKVHSLTRPSFRIVWYDYPGGWWETTPRDAQESEARKQAFAKLLTSHVGILLVDGAMYLTNGLPYVQRFVDQFRNEARKIVDEFAEAGQPLEALPQQWLIAISKSDILPNGTTAEAICKDIVSGAGDQLAGVARVFNSRAFGSQYLLLSSVRGDGNRVLDASAYVGLQLIAPIALLFVLNELASKAGTGQAYGVPRAIFERLAALVSLIDHLDDFLPPKYQILTQLLKALALKEGLDKGAEYFRERQDQAARKGRQLEAAAAAMKAELSNKKAQSAYFRNQG
jgi:GTPase SAR1 family protein